MPYAFRHQPMKGLYLTYQLFSTLFVRIPVWLLLAIPRQDTDSPRVIPLDSYDDPPIQITASKESMDFETYSSCEAYPSLHEHCGQARHCSDTSHLIRILTTSGNRTGPLKAPPNHLAIVPGVDINGVWVEPTPKLITGELETWMNVSSVSPIAIPGYWVNKRGSTINVGSPPTLGEKVVYALHGGAYIRLSAYPKDLTSTIVRGLLEHIDSVHRVFSIEYRLSSTKPFEVANPFPAALLDALAGYNYLVNVVGFYPTDVIIEGDSAGGNLALALTRYLVEYKDSLNVSPPGALVLLSPWPDIGVSHDTPGSSHFTCLPSDYIGHFDYKGINYAKDAFVGPHGMGAAALNRYISPASKHPALTVNFSGFPRTFIVSGGAEILLDQIRTLKNRMTKDLGEGNGARENEGKVRYYEAPDGIHDYIIFFWHEPERTETLKEIAKWVAAF